MDKAVTTGTDNPLLDELGQPRAVLEKLTPEESAQLLSLLEEIRRDLGLTIVFIAHQLAVISRLADRVAIMYLGKIVETGATADVFANPRHPYTKALLEAHPRIDGSLELAAEVVDPQQPMRGLGVDNLGATRLPSRLARNSPIRIPPSSSRRGRICTGNFMQGAGVTITRSRLWTPTESRSCAPWSNTTSREYENC